ncbi:MAG TPA: tetratricopeptide repeat protein [Rhizomicrobium sp.]|nr:tetratricopeptide repeat protein [Rhizomicrobium sp.]
MADDLARMMNEAVRLHQSGRLDEAISAYRRILTRDSRQPQAHSNLGVALRSRGALEEAEHHYRKAIAAKPDFVDAHANLANLLMHSRPAEALEFYKRAIALKPDDAGILYNYGVTLQRQGATQDAVSVYRRALALRPAFTDAWNNLGVALADQNKLAEAADACRRAIALDARSAQAYNNLGLVLQEQGLLEEAVAAFEQAVHLEPGHSDATANRIFAELYRPGVQLADMLRLAQRWSAVSGPAMERPGSQGTRPRLGFLSADFRQHAVGFLVISALEGLSRLGFEIVCYSNSARKDILTERFRKASTVWRDVFGMTDTELERHIRADNIGILFDLAGYSRGNHLALIMRRLAPVQIGWVGYPATTGVPAMDYMLCDNWQTPEGADVFYSEKLLRMPHSYIAFDPPHDAPDPGSPPALANGFVTFGSFNALKKINAQIVNAWARILKAVPGARLLLKCPALDCPETRSRAVAIFQAAGIVASRLELMGSSSPQDHVRAMTRADIALDSFPYSGGMTTLEALWMGMPVITWPGETFASRHSLGYLSVIGLESLVASSLDDYVDLAVRLAGDMDRLCGLRESMRSRITASRLADRDGFSEDLARILMAVWTAEAPAPEDQAAASLTSAAASAMGPF